MRHRTSDILLVVIFLAFVGAPLVATVADIANGPDSYWEEWRAQTPDLEPTRDSLLAFPGKFKWYFLQRYGLREFLVHLHAKLMVDLVGVSSTDKVLLGRDGWLYLSTVTDFRNLDPFPAETLDAWVADLSARRDWLRARGTDYVVVVAPNKHTIYPEHFPERYRKVRARSRLDQFVEHLKAHGIDVVDLRPALRRARDAGRVFHRTDSHWNLVGGREAAREIVDHLNARGCRLRPIPPDFAVAEPTVTHAGDLGRMLGLASDWFEEVLVPDDVPRIRDENGNELEVFTLDVKARDLVETASGYDGPRAVVFRDSFGEALLPWLASRFSRASFVWSYKMDTGIVESLKPDVVIQQITERKLMTLVPGNGTP